ncbi:MAG: hypothetical protein K0S56_3080 [Microvirga sp.]|jgi:hypothetical protein|nr:hypothetical protein [Microvirga sp.]
MSQIVALPEPEPVTSADAFERQVEGYVAHLEELQRVFNSHAEGLSLPVRLDVTSVVDAVRSGLILDRVGSYFTRPDDSGVLHDAQLMTALDCITQLLSNAGQNGVVLGAMQSGKTTTSLALQFAGPIIYALTGRRIYPIYLTTSHTSQEDQTNIELTNFLNYYSAIKIVPVPGAPSSVEVSPGFARSPTIAYYRAHVLRDALGDIHMGPRPEDFIQRRVHGQQVGQIAELCRRANEQGFEPLLMIDEPQYGASDRLVMNEEGVAERRPCVLLQIFQSIEGAMIASGRHSFIGLSATPYELHELESVWLVRQYLAPTYRGFNYFGGRVISEGVEIEPPSTFGFSGLATHLRVPELATVSLQVYGAPPNTFPAMARRLGYTGSQADYRAMVHRVMRQAILAMVAAAPEPIGICIRPFNNNTRARAFIDELDLETAGIEVINYFGPEYAGVSVKRALGQRRHADRPFVIVVTNRARMGDAFPARVTWFIDFARQAADLNSLLQGLLGRACGYNKNSTVVLSDQNQGLVEDYRRGRGGYFYPTSRHSIVVGARRRGAPTNVIRLRADMDDNVVRAFFRRLEADVVNGVVLQDRANLSTTRQRDGSPRTGAILRIAEELGLFDHLESPEVSSQLFPTFPTEFHIARAGDAVPHARDPQRFLRYQLDENGDCRFTFRWTSGGGSHTGVTSRGYGARDATDRARAADNLEPQIHMEKYDPETGEVFFDKAEQNKRAGDWRPYMITLPLVTPVRELQEGLATYPNERSPYADLMNEEERDEAGFP